MQISKVTRESTSPIPANSVEAAEVLEWRQVCLSEEQSAHAHIAKSLEKLRNLLTQVVRREKARRMLLKTSMSLFELESDPVKVCAVGYRGCGGAMTARIASLCITAADAEGTGGAQAQGLGPSVLVPCEC